MTLIRTIPPEEATGKLRELYDADLEAQGSIREFTKRLSLRPEAIVGIRALRKALRSITLTPRHYRLVRVFAASRVRCTV